MRQSYIHLSLQRQHYHVGKSKHQQFKKRERILLQVHTLTTSCLLIMVHLATDGAQPHPHRLHLASVQRLWVNFTQHCTVHLVTPPRCTGVKAHPTFALKKTQTMTMPCVRYRSAMARFTLLTPARAKVITTMLSQNGGDCTPGGINVLVSTFTKYYSRGIQYCITDSGRMLWNLIVS